MTSRRRAKRPCNCASSAPKASRRWSPLAPTARKANTPANSFRPKKAPTASKRKRAWAAKCLGKDRGSFTAAFAYGETDDGLPRLDLLKQIAENSKGEYFSINDWNDKALEKIAAKLESIAPSQLVEQRQTRLWSTLWPFAIVLALLSVEWWMRRKWGLI